MKLYHCPNTRSVRIVWLLEELGLDYDLISMPLGDKSMREPEYLAKHPAGRVPALEDGDVTLFESGAIVEYLIARYGQGRMRPAPESPDFPVYLQWLHYAEGMIMPQINVIVVETKFLPPEKQNPVNLARAQKLLTRMLAIVDQHMEGRDFLAGDFSGADIMTGHACCAGVRFGGEIAIGDHVKSYTDRLMARPALAKAFAA